MRVLATIAVALIFGFAALGIFWLRRRIEGSASGKRLNRRLTIAAVVCMTVFTLINVLDWPGGVLAFFWAEHAIFAATASTIPLIGAGFFAFTAVDARVQDDLDRAVAATGRGGVVDHLVDVDVTLALVVSVASVDELRQVWPSYTTDGRPLRWLREGRDRLGGTMTDPKPSDPRSRRPLQDPRLNDWRSDLIDQAIRRVMAGIKEWGPILGQSRDGRNDLVALGEIRLALLAAGTESSGLDAVAVCELQKTCRTLGLSMELRSGVNNPRSELLAARKEPDPVSRTP